MFGRTPTGPPDAVGAGLISIVPVNGWARRYAFAAANCAGVYEPGLEIIAASCWGVTAVWTGAAAPCDAMAYAARAGVAGDAAENASTASAPLSARINGRILIDHLHE